MRKEEARSEGYRYNYVQDISNSSGSGQCGTLVRLVTLNNFLRLQQVMLWHVVRHATFSATTGCPKSWFLYFISLYFSTIGLGKQIISTKFVSFNIIHCFHTCRAIFWREYAICVLPHQRWAYTSFCFSHISFVFQSPNCSNSFHVFLCEYHERATPLTQKRLAAWEHKPGFDLLAYLL